MQSTEVYPNLEKICRLCLKEDVATVEIFPTLSPRQLSRKINRISIPMFIMSCAALEVQVGDDLPKKICRNCRYQLEKAYYFRKRSQDSDVKLRKHIRLLSLGKVSRIFRGKRANCTKSLQNSSDSKDFIAVTMEGVLKVENQENSLVGENDSDSDDDDYNEYDELEDYEKAIDCQDPDGMTFVQIMDKERAQNEEKQRQELCQRIQDEYEQKLKEERVNIEKNCWIRLKEKLELELRKKIHEEMKSNLELEIREQCLKEARLQLRAEVQQECREEELQHLLTEMENFLRSKKGQSRQRQQSKDHQSNGSDQLESVEYELEDGTTIINNHLGNLRSQVQIEETSMNKESSSYVEGGVTTLDQDLKDAIIIKDHLQISDVDDMRTGNKNPQEMENGIDFLIYDGEIVNEQFVHQQQTLSNNNLKILNDLEDSQSHELVQLLETEDDDVDDDMEEEGEGEGEEVATDSIAESQDTTTSYQIDDYENGHIKVFKNLRKSETDNNLDLMEMGENVMIINLQGLTPMDPENGGGEHLKMINQDEEMEQDNSCEMGDNDQFGGKSKKMLFAVCKRKRSLESMFNDEKSESTNKESDNLTEFNEDDKSKIKCNPLQRVTDTLKTFKCNSCPIVFSTKASLERHLKVHEKGGNFQCPECHIVLSCNSALRRHMYVHAKQKPFGCEECGKSFVQKEILTRHQLTHSGIRPHSCPHCDRSFSQRINLQHHINRHHLEVPKIQQYPCHLCPKRFQHASGLSRHLASHGGVAFQCSECERTFGDRSSIKRHIANVHGNGHFEKSKLAN